VVKRRSLVVGACLALSIAGCSLVIGDLGERPEAAPQPALEGGDGSLAADRSAPPDDATTDAATDARDGAIVHGCTYRGEKRGVPSTVYSDGDAGVSDFDVGCDGVVYADVRGGVFACAATGCDAGTPLVTTLAEGPKLLAVDGKDVLVLSTVTAALERIGPGGAIAPVHSWSGRNVTSLHAHAGRAVVGSSAGSPRTKADAVQVDGGGFLNLLTNPSDNFGLVYAFDRDVFYEAGQTNASADAIRAHDIRDGGTTSFTDGGSPSKLGAMFRLAASGTFVVWLYNGSSLAACKVPCTTPTAVTINGAELEKGSFFYADDELFYFRGSGGSGGLFACTADEVLTGNCTAIALSLTFPEISVLRSDRDYVYWLSSDGTTIGRIAK
jgi:hypothetical protein